MTIDLSAPRYAALQPPKFVESELRAFLRDEHRQRRPLPTLRAIKARFGGGATRIHRIRRSVEIELGLREPEVRPTRVRRAAGRLERLIETIERLLEESRDVPARDPGTGAVARATGPAVDWTALKKSWDYLADRHDAIHQRLDTTAHQQDRMGSHLLHLVDLVASRQRGLAKAAEQFEQHAGEFLDRQEDALISLARTVQAARRSGVDPTDIDNKALQKRLDALDRGQVQILDAQQRLGSTVQDLARTTSRVHNGLDAAADRLESASKALTDAGEAAVPRQAAALKRLEAAARTLEQAARDAGARAEQVIVADRTALHAQLQGLDQKLTRLIDIAAAPAPGAIDLPGEVRALGEQLGSQIAAASATTGKAIERQRRASDRAAARSSQALSELHESVAALGRRRPPRTVHLHDDSLKAINDAMARRLASVARARKRAESATSPPLQRQPSKKQGIKAATTRKPPSR